MLPRTMFRELQKVDIQNISKDGDSKISGQHVAVFSYPQSKKVFLLVHREPLLFQLVFMPLALSLGAAGKNLAPLCILASGIYIH